MEPLLSASDPRGLPGLGRRSDVAVRPLERVVGHRLPARRGREWGRPVNSLYSTTAFDLPRRFAASLLTEAGIVWSLSLPMTSSGGGASLWKGTLVAAGGGKFAE